MISPDDMKALRAFALGRTTDIDPEAVAALLSVHEQLSAAASDLLRASQPFADGSDELVKTVRDGRKIWHRVRGGRKIAVGATEYEDLDVFIDIGRAADRMARLYDGRTTPPLDEPLVWLLRMMQATGGEIDASDNRWSPLNLFCGDRGEGLDTFNLAINLGLVQSSHDSDFDTSRAWLTTTGKAYVAELPAVTYGVDSALIDAQPAYRRTLKAD
ncbi:hypothetical protein KIKIMORA_00660 [Brevundimonas phage vB_BpoS-Kikimora]|uniref:Uncharacterized protein n=1 Tax=Brevundimonas phage vB_BpoS-Kikimora TaxID=2948601 RepID=A0A9E7MRC1_9CAUD|nr:hypothetical protein KIKIMORA_00660 [Brevundimonas phage vB_BpoS-Kikimora]